MTTAVNPFALALRTQRQGVRYNGVPAVGRRTLQGFAGFWGDLWDKGQQAINDWADSQLTQSGTSTHIAAQNQAGAELSSILNSYHAGTINANTAITQITSTVSGFVLFCQRLGYAEALAGAAQIQTLGNQIIHDIQAEVAQGVRWSNGQRITGTPTATTAGLSTGAIAAIVAVAFFLLRRR